MKKTKLLLPILTALLILPSCDLSVVDDGMVTTDYYCIMRDDYTTQGTFHYKNDYFRADPKTFDSGLALMSFVAAANSGQKKEMEKYHRAINFSPFYHSKIYDTGSQEDTYGIYLASRTIDDFDVISLSFRSYDYTLEWVSNVTLGETGNHEGFESASNGAIEEFTAQVKDKFAGKKLKLWVNGFSRGGALANMFTTKLLNGNDLGFTTDNVYCYTFEAPAGFTEENRKDYPNIFNCTNKADIVVNVPPAEYGLYRSGIDVELMKEDTDFDKLFADYVHSIYNDEDAQALIDDFPKFKANTTERTDISPEKYLDKYYKNELEFMKYAIHKIITYENEDFGIKNRAQYVKNVQPVARLGSKILFSLNYHQKAAMLIRFNANYLAEGRSGKLVTLISSFFKDEINPDTGNEIGEDNLYEFVKEYLYYANFQYDDAELRSGVKTLRSLILEFDVSTLVGIFEHLSNYRRALYFHWHEATYVLVKALGE